MSERRHGDGCVFAAEETLRADRAERALRDRERQLARVLAMADAWQETWGDQRIRADVAAESLRREIRGLEFAPGVRAVRTAVVWVHPGRLGGQPCIYGHRLATVGVAVLVYDLGVERVMAMYHLERREVLGACWFEAIHGRPRRRAWVPWVKKWGDRMWSGDWDAVPDPPRAES